MTGTNPVDAASKFLSGGRTDFCALEERIMNKMRAVFFSLLGITLLSVAVVAQDPLPKEIRGGILNGKATSLPRPEYPAEAKAAGLEGTVYVNVVIDESGNVISAVASTDTHKVYRSKGEQAGEQEVPPADPILRDAAERAALQAKFSPTRLSGQPVKVAGTIVYNFVIQSSTIVDLSKGDVEVLNGKAVSLPRPEYPAAARAVKAGGAVSVKVIVDEGGEVISATAVSGHPLLRAAAVEAAKLAKFSPTIVEGRTAKVVGFLTYNFVGPKEDSN
jgi:TonB family protein